MYGDANRRRASFGGRGTSTNLPPRHGSADGSVTGMGASCVEGGHLSRMQVAGPTRLGHLIDIVAARVHEGSARERLTTLAGHNGGHMKEFQAELLFDTKGQLSESPQWSSAEQALYWVDIENGLLHRFEWQRRSHECVSLSAPVTMVVPGPPLLVTSGNRLLRFDWNTRQSQQIAALPLDPARLRFNDGKLDPRGRLWLGTMAIDEKSPIAGLYRLAGHTLEQVLADVRISNGIIWRGDTMYYADS